MGLRRAARDPHHGGQPHYLLIATSLLRDGDLDVLNNYRESTTSLSTPTTWETPASRRTCTLSTARAGAFTPSTAWAAPAAAPGDAPGRNGEGHGLAIVFMLGVAAALSTQIFLLARETTGRAVVAIVAWTAVAFTSPLLLYAGQIYPEVPGALLVVWGVRAVWRASAPGAPATPGGGRRGMKGLTGAPGRPCAWEWRWRSSPGCTCATSPWPRCWPWPVWPPALPGDASSGPCWRPARGGGVAAVGPQLAPLRGPPSGRRVRHLRRAERPHGHPGALLDQQFGLLVYAPVYLIALFGLPLVPHRLPGLRGAVLLAVLGLYTLFVAAFSFWYGAYSPPSRMLVPVLPLLVAPLALALAEWRAAPFRLVSAALLLLSWSIARLLMDVPRLRYNLPTGRSEMLAYLSATWGQDVTAYVPSFVLPTPRLRLGRGGHLPALAAVPVAHLRGLERSGRPGTTPAPDLGLPRAVSRPRASRLIGAGGPGPGPGPGRVGHSATLARAIGAVQQSLPPLVRDAGLAPAGARPLRGRGQRRHQGGPRRGPRGGPGGLRLRLRLPRLRGPLAAPPGLAAPTLGGDAVAPPGPGRYRPGSLDGLARRRGRRRPAPAVPAVVVAILFPASLYNLVFGQFAPRWCSTPWVGRGCS